MKPATTPKSTFTGFELIGLSSIALTLLCLIWHFLTYYGQVLGAITY